MHDFFVDDILSGADSLEAAIKIRDSLVEILSRGGFQLRKLTSNCKSLISPQDNTQTDHVNIDIQPSTKTLGVY